MNPKLLRLVILFITIAMVGLVGIQIYWVKDAYQQRHLQFIQSSLKAMNESLMDYEKYRIEKQMNSMFDMNSIENKMLSYVDSATQSKSKISRNSRGEIQQITIDVTGNNFFFLDKSFKNSKFSQDPFGLGKDPMTDPAFNIKGMTDNEIKEKNQQMSQQGKLLMESIMQDLFDSYINSHATFIDSLAIDSIVKQKLINQGIYTQVEYGIYNPYLDSLYLVKSKNIKDLKNSDFKMPMSMGKYYDEYMLILHFPNQTAYLFKNMLPQIISFIVLLTVIILLFYYTIHTIIKQKKISEIKSDLVNNITHELKTPISTISLACQAMNDPDLLNSPLKNTYLKMISEENKRLALLVENVLQSAVFEKGDYKLKLKKTDLHYLIEKSTDGLSIQAENHKVKIEKELNAIQPIFEADEVLITNLIYNLVDNAIKYSKPNNEDSKIKIKTYNKNTMYVTIEIEDNGIGISKENLNKVFEKLYRVPTGNVHNVKGYGLGLSYVKTIIDHHQGTIDVESKLGEGSRFIVTLPIVQKEK